MMNEYPDLNDYAFSSDSDDNEFKNLLEKATCGDAAAQCHLGNRYHEGKGVKTDYEKAVSWYTKFTERTYPDSPGLVESYVKVLLSLK